MTTGEQLRQMRETLEKHTGYKAKKLHVTTAQFRAMLAEGALRPGDPSLEIVLTDGTVEDFDRAVRESLGMPTA